MSYINSNVWFEAAKKGDLAIIEKMLAEGAGVNDRNCFGRTALIWASDNAHLSVVEKLIDANADVNAKDNSQYTALMWASLNGHFSVVEKLIDANAGVNTETHRGTTALALASKWGYVSVVEKLLARGAEVDTKDDDGYSALILAAYNNHLHVVEKLLAWGADSEIFKRMDMYTIERLIIQAIKEKRYELTDLLLDNPKTIKLTQWIADILEYKNIMKDNEEKELVKKYLVKRYGNILMVLWGKYPGFTVFEAIIDNFCPTWKEFLTLSTLYELWGETKYIVRGTINT
jgi:ankyrin repeat protein